jgi:hypothetical protein
MPALGKFGFHFAIKRAYIENPGNGYIYSFDRTNHKVRIWLGAAQTAVTVSNHVGVAPTGNVAATPAVSAGTPAGNLANLAAGAFTGDSKTPTGNLSNLTAAPHSHSLVVANNASGAVVDFIGINANNGLTSNNANVYTVPGDVAANGGIANTTPGNGTGVFTGDAATPTGNVANGTGVFTGAALATHVHGAQTFTGDAPANFTHTVTGGDAVLESPLAEMDNTVAPASVTLYMEMVGR